MSNNIYVRNHFLPNVTSNISQWHHDRNLINGATDETQAKKLLEEFTELVASIHPDKSPEFIYDEIVSMLDNLLSNGRIKPVTAAEAQAAKKDALGDMYVVQVNIAERNDMLMSQCIQSAWAEIKDRKGEMRDGVFVKEEDL